MLKLMDGSIGRRARLILALTVGCCVSLTAFAVDGASQANPFGVSPITPEKIHDQSFVMFGIMLTIFIVWSLWKKKLALGLLVMFGAMMTSWQEFFADWGGYLYWNPEFPQLPWGEMAFTTPVKPLFIPFSWAWYFALIIPLLALGIGFLHRFIPKVPKLLLIVVIVGPVFWGYNMLTEKTAGDLAWWGYLEAFGPVAQATYSQYPLIWPAFSLVLWNIVLLWIIMNKGDDGFWSHERLLGVDTMPVGLKRSVLRFLSFALMFNATCLIVVTIPCMLARILFGVDSPLIP